MGCGDSEDLGVDVGVAVGVDIGVEKSVPDGDPAGLDVFFPVQPLALKAAAVTRVDISNRRRQGEQVQGFMCSHSTLLVGIRRPCLATSYVDQLRHTMPHLNTKAEKNCSIAPSVSSRRAVSSCVSSIF